MNSTSNYRLAQNPGVSAFVLIAMLSLSLRIASAQSPVVLTVEAGGAIAADIPCPEVRDNDTYASIQAAVNCAEAGDTLAIAPGSYFENMRVDKSLIIQGSGAGSTIVDGGMAGRVFTIANDVTVTLSDMTISGGDFDSGAGIYSYSGTLTLERLLIDGNTAATSGAGVYTQTGVISITDSTISNNTVSVYSNSSKLADGAGGGVYTYSGQVQITNSIITGNVVNVQTCGKTPASARGGGLYTFTGIVSIVGSTISGNTVSATACSSNVDAIAEGDGIYTFDAPVQVSDSQISDRVIAGNDGEITGNTEVVSEPVTTVEADATTAPGNVVAVIEPTLAAPTETTQDAHLALRWMAHILDGVQEAAYSPPVASRIYAYTGITLYEALLPGMTGHRSLSGQLNGMPAMPQPEVGLNYNWELAANSALDTVTAGLFKTAPEAVLQSFSDLRAAVENEQGETVPVNVFNRSRAYGEALGQAILAWAGSDNYDLVHQLSYTLPIGDPSFWIPLQDQKPLEPYWGELRPFALPSASYCDIPVGIEFSTDPNSAFYAQADEVRKSVNNLSPDQKDIALFWADSAGETATPPGHWVSIENQMIDHLNLSLDQAAEMYALTGIALGDAFISAWETKYHIQLIRPVSFIDSYIDPNWTTFINTPPFPEYPSGHSVGSGAAATILTHLFGEVAFIDNTHQARGLAARSFSSFMAAANEAALSRLYGGIHYRFSIENGLQQGEEVAQNVITKIILRT